MTTNDLSKTVQYDPETRDYAMYLGGDLVGFAASEPEAWRRLDELVYSILSHEARLMPVEPEPAVPTPAQVAAACSALAEEYTDAAAAHAEQGNAEAAKDLQSAARAARKAAFYAPEGERVARWVGSDLLVMSATDRLVYTVRSSGCHCKAAEHGRSCWHLMLRLGHERAMDVIDQAPAGDLVLAA